MYYPYVYIHIFLLCCDINVFYQIKAFKALTKTYIHVASKILYACFLKDTDRVALREQEKQKDENAISRTVLLL